MMERQQLAGDTRPESRARLRLRAAVTAFTMAGALAVAVTPAAAQSEVGNPRDAAQATTVGELVDKLFVFQAPYNPQNVALSLEDFRRRAADSREGINIGIGNALTSFPLGASSAGFTYLQNATTGERELKAVSFGPVFVERSLTNGKGVLNFGASFQAMKFDTLQGLNVRDDGYVVESLMGTYSDGSQVGDASRVQLDIDSKLVLFSGSYGVTDRFDFGWAVPIVNLSARGRYLHDYNGGKEWDNNASYINPQGQRIFIRDVYPGKTGTDTLVDRTVSTTGLGDVVVRAKYGLGSPDAQVAAISADIRLPTGDEENLLGNGKASVRFTVGGSKRLGESASISGNGGYTVGGLTDEINFALGAEMAVLPSKQLTLTFDLIGQQLRDTITELGFVETERRTISDVPNGFPARETHYNYALWDRGSTTLLRGAVGAKLAIGGNWLLTAAALFRLNDNGFQPKVVPFIGLEHTWTRN
ncbi:MAG: hypothetical protein ABIU38_15465 [Vicinamibacteraceae bacterium]